MTVPAAPTGPSGVSAWNTVFSDDFPGTSLNTSVWYPGGQATGTASIYSPGFNCTGTPPTPAGNTAINSTAMVSVASSICTLTCQAIPGGATVTAGPTVGGTSTVYSYETGCIQTGPNSYFGHTQPGFTYTPSTRTCIEWYAKVPPGSTGIWPALWTSSVGLWTYEVDIMEGFGATSSTAPNQNIHYISGGGSTNNAQSGPHVSSVSDLSTAFHRFTADINTDGAGNVDFYIDGTHQVSWSEVGYATSTMALIANLQNSSTTPTGLPATLQIDYVAVYTPVLTSAGMSVAALTINASTASEAPLITPITVTGNNIRGADESLANGQIGFQLLQPIGDGSTTIVSTNPIYATITNGAFSAVVYANNDPGTIPANTAYQVTFVVDNQQWSAFYIIPYNATLGTVNIASLLPVTPGAGNFYSLGAVTKAAIIASGVQASDIGGISSSGVLLKANNLSDVNSASAARTNLGLGTASVLATTGVLQPSNNLSDLALAATARTNLGLGTAALLAGTGVLQPANNLNDVNNTTTALNNLGVPTVTDVRYRTRYAPYGTVEYFIDDSNFGADASGATDSTSAFTGAVAACATALTNGAPGAYIVMGAGNYKLTCGNVATTSSAIGLIGPDQNACTITCSGSGAAFKRVQTSHWASSVTTSAAIITGFTMDGIACGTSTAAGGVLDVDVMRGWYRDIIFQNFLGPAGESGFPTTSTAHSYGLCQYNASFWAERCIGERLTFYNNTIGHLQDGGTSTGPASFDYSWFDSVSIKIYSGGQRGRYLINGANAVGGAYHMVTNAAMGSISGASYLLAVGYVGASSDSSNITSALLSITGETDGSGTTAIYDINISASSGLLGHGIIALTSGGTAFSAPSGMVFADGVINGEVSTPSFFRPIYTVGGISGAITTKPGAWTCNQTTRYGLQLPASQGTAPTTGVTIYSGVGVPTFTANAAGDKYERSDGSTGTHRYVASGSPASTWTALAEWGRW
jgi:hypothetical protein